MIPVIMRKEIDRLMPQLGAPERIRQSEKESAAIIGFTSAVAAYGAFFIPKSYGTSIAATGGPEAALWAFMIFYAICAVVTWFYYTRRAGLAVRHRASIRIHTADRCCHLIPIHHE